MKLARAAWISSLLAALLAAMSSGACLRTPLYQCQSSSQCDLGAQAGRCESNGYCSVSDDGCTSGFRWASGAPLAGACVGAPTAETVDVCLPQHKLDASADSCVAKVCAADARCCEREWSAQCVQAAQTACQKSCGTITASIGNGHINVQRWNGSGYDSIWSKTTVANPNSSAIAWGARGGGLSPELATCESSPADGQPGTLSLWQGGGTCSDAFCLIEQVDVGDCYHVALEDVDNDGDLDVIAGGSYMAYLWIDDQGLFADTTIDPFFGNINAFFDFADLDGDGLPDIALAQYGDVMTVRRATYAAPAPVSYATELWNDAFDAANQDHKVAKLADVDNDGVLDLVVGTSNDIQVWRNTSTTGGFAASTTPLFDLEGYSVDSLELADVDEDGDLDIVAFADGGQVMVLRNNVAGPAGEVGFTMTPMWQSTEMFNSGRVAVADVDGDHHLDLIVGTRPDTSGKAPTTPSAIYLNQPLNLGHFGITEGTAEGTANYLDPSAAAVDDIAVTGMWP